MNFLIFFLNLVLFGSVEGKDDSKIQQGKPTDIKRFPFLASYRTRRGAKCSAVIVNPITAITAGHCVIKHGIKRLEVMEVSYDHPYLVMGVTDWTDKTNEFYQEREIARVFVHGRAQFGLRAPVATRFDIGAMKWYIPVVLNERVQLAPLVPERFYEYIYYEMTGTTGHCEVAGWGDPKYSYEHQENVGVAPDILHSAKFSFFTRRDCCFIFFERGDFKVCMERLEGGGFECAVRLVVNTSIAYGDSGSPLICPFKGSCYVVGIVTGGASYRREKGGAEVVNPTFFIKPSVIASYIKEISKYEPIYLSSAKKTDDYYSAIVVTILPLVRFVV